MKDAGDDMANEYQFYYYLTTLDAKIILMIEKKDLKKEDKIKTLLQNVHKYYAMVTRKSKFR